MNGPETPREGTERCEEGTIELIEKRNSKLITNADNFYPVFLVTGDALSMTAEDRL